MISDDDVTDDLEERVLALLDAHDPATTDPREFLGAQYDAGLAWVHLPQGFGGLGLPRKAQEFVDAELSAAGAPVGGTVKNFIGMGMAAPTIAAFGTDEQKRKFLRPLFTGEQIYCQLVSEPGAGSDLAAAATRAVRDGDEWVVNGQKVWTSSAHVADLALAVCRTDPDVPKHQGLTTFLVDMHAPGVEVRPLRQMTGTAGFNEVFLTDVRVPDSHRVGELNKGFGVILTTLGNERTIATRATSGTSGIGQFERLLGVVYAFGDRNDPRQRQRLAQLYLDVRIRELLIDRWRAALRPGETPGPEMSVLKLHSCRHNIELVRMLTEVLGSRLAADTGEWGTFAWAEYVLSTPGARIGG